jgi:hypothetical protein
MSTATRLTVGSTRRFRATFTLDGAAKDLTTASVTLLLRAPGGEVLEREATVVDAAGGVAQYVSLTTDLSVAGRWSRSWRVVDGALDIPSDPVWFTVVAAP